MTAKLLSKTINKQKETFIAPDCTESRFSTEFEYFFQTCHFHWIGQKTNDKTPNVSLHFYCFLFGFADIWCLVIDF